MKTLFNRFIKDESGATAIEYGLIAALIAVAIIGALNALSTELNALFGRVDDTLASAASTPAATP
jgi:pilus assembly protein Flp/PilA